MVVFGIGAGLAFPSLMTIAMSGVEMSEAGLASGLVNTAAQVGGAIGLAVLATVSASRSEDLIASGTAEAQALTDGYHLAFWIGAGLVAAAIAVAVAAIDKKALDRAAEMHGAPDEPQPSDEPALEEVASGSSSMGRLAASRQSASRHRTARQGAARMEPPSDLRRRRQRSGRTRRPTGPASRESRPSRRLR